MKKIGFSEYYRDIFHDRWESLYESLLSGPHYYSLEEGLLKPYYLDKASYIAARQLPLKGKSAVLDMCAAPGGKALVLAAGMDAAAEITVNERSAVRRNRLKQVLEEHLPGPILSRVQITGHDATKWGLYRKEAYDAVLLDVPCSSERHIVQSDSHVKKWTPARSKHLAIQAYAMLASALMTVRPGGHILYSTCALLDRENDDVIGKLMHREGDTCVALPGEGDFGEKTEFGVQIMPDRCHGMGPIYFALLEKR